MQSSPRADRPRTIRVMSRSLVWVLFLTVVAACAGTTPNPRLDPLRALVEASPDDVETLLELAHAAVAEEEYKEARRTFRKVTKLRPEDADAWYWYGITENHLGHQDRAEPHWRQAIELDSTHMMANKIIGTLNLNRIIMFERAADEPILGRAAGSALTIMQGSLLVVWEMRVADVLDWYQETLDIWKRVARLESEEALNWGNLGIIGNLVGAYSDSKTCFETAVGLAPDFLKNHQLHAEFHVASSMDVRWTPSSNP